MKKHKKKIYPNGGLWYIRYQDPISKKWKGKSTGLKAIDQNIPAAEKMQAEFELELQELVGVDYTEGSIQEAFEAFKSKNSNKNAGTIGTYDYFLKFLKQKFNVNNSCLVITKKSAEDFFLYISQLEGYARNTKFGIVKNFSKFLKFLFEYNYLPKPFVINSDVKTRMYKGEIKIFDDKDRQTILRKLRTEKKNPNFTLFIKMLMYTGLRPSDLIYITVDHVDLKKMVIKYYSPKVDKWYSRPLHSELKIPLRSRIKEVISGKLFAYENIDNLGKAFRRYMEDIGLDNKGYNLRTFRKDFISRCQEAGVPITAASLLVGHSKLTTTMDYYTRLSEDFLRDELNKLD
jgi:integrase